MKITNVHVKRLTGLPRLLGTASVVFDDCFKKGICFDYANLFAVMCRYADIPCYIVDGYRCDDKSKKHTWNRVYYDDTWWNLDTTNDSIRLKQGIALYGFVDIGNDYTMPDKDYVITRYY